MAQTLNDPLAVIAPDAREFCKRTWWVFLIGGIASVAFGIFAFVSPGAALLVLGLFFACYLFIDGVANVFGAWTHRDKDGWWFMLLLGVLGIIVGAYALLVPLASMIALVYLVAIMAFVVGGALLSLGWRIRKAVSNEWVLYVTGALSALLGALILARPVVGGLSIAYMVATWAVLIGVLRIVIAFRVRSFPERVAAHLTSPGAH